MEKITKKENKDGQIIIYVEKCRKYAIRKKDICITDNKM